jgi:hypothetical protein
VGRYSGWTTKMTGRPALRSPGRPPIRRDVERAFWAKIAEGMGSEDAARNTSAGAADLSSVRPEPADVLVAASVVELEACRLGAGNNLANRAGA